MKTKHTVPSPLSVKRVAYEDGKSVDIVAPSSGGISVPLTVNSLSNGNRLQHWLEENRGWWEDKLHSHGAILFRRFPHAQPQELDAILNTVTQQPLEYKERSSPRSQVYGRIYTSTDYPSHEEIYFHNENSYQSLWPQTILFYCSIPADKGGETPICDIRRVFKRIPREIQDKFREKKVLYVRNFGGPCGFSWEAAFQTSDRDQVEEYCKKQGIDFKWRSSNRLQTRSVREAIRRHPRTKEEVWFNHAVFFHISTLGAELKQGLLQQFGEDDLPNQSYYGDGTPIEEEVLSNIRRAYEEEQFRFSWNRGDLLLLDNMLFAHSRTSFEGNRSVFVGMGDICPLEECAVSPQEESVEIE